MRKSITRRRAPFVRHSLVAEHLRRRILSGANPPGSRLPTQLELQRRFRTTPVTVQRAFDRLAEEGFIGARSNAGSFVSSHPPHIWHYGLLLPNSPRAMSWSRFHEALSIIAREASALGPRRIVVYHDVDRRQDGEAYQRLLQDVAAHRIAGLMFSFAPHDLIGTPMLDLAGVPRVSVSSNHASLPVVGGVSTEPITTAARWIAARGRKRVAIITLPSSSQETLQQRVEHAGLMTRPFWMQAVEAHHTAWVRNAVHAVLHSNPADRPDALLVTDDHLVEAVADALIEFGVRVPDDMLVVGHWNFPLKFNRDLPVQLIGVDNVELLRRWVAAIDSQRRGESLPARTQVPPVLAGEGKLCDPVEIQRLPAPVSSALTTGG